MRFQTTHFKRAFWWFLLLMLLGACVLSGCHKDEPPASPNAATAAPARLPNQDLGKTDILKRGQGPK
ncbi:MAG TPA: hypothetical protein VKV18_00590 [Chthonomonas sp.]|uniref:hypothetical protein n=1 Tax=Chthonomonas sp. TaxID=2282153 RepID=UPI002B4B50FC|nr:hypothetical protein [Chthonomonas sp.]HLI47175.1 hypothetical protein [Chthonomonas sp.]